VSPASTLVVGGAAPLRGRIRVPGDKSISHRALLFAAIADGR
jgi:3-phosphoshikimate 1-carboxyvinyltransferase